MRNVLRSASVPALALGMTLFVVTPGWAQRGGHGGGHAGGGHAGGGHAAGAYHGGGSFHAGNVYHGAGSFHAGNVYHGAGSFHAGNVYHGAGSFHAGNVYHGAGSYGGYRAGGAGLAYGSLYRPYNYGLYRPYHSYYRPYYGYGYGLGGFGPYYGYGLGLGGLGYGLGLGGYGLYSPYYSGLGIAAYSSFYPDPSVALQQAPVNPAPATASERPPADDAAHLQLTVPENAEVIIDGNRTTQTGATREFVSPTLTPGTAYVYKITVRHPDAQGKMIDDTRDIRFQANDWFAIDFTRPAPATPAPAPRPATKQ